MRINQFLQPKKTLLEDQRIAANIVTDVLLELSSLSKPDLSLDMLDELAERRIRERGGVPYNKGYKPDWALKPFPATVCMSVDYEICHGIPRGRILKDGSIIKYDVGVQYKSGCGDAALTVAVGNIDNRKQRAMRYGLQALYEGIKMVKAGQKISAIGEAISGFAGLRGYAVIKEYGGHHIGRKMHMKPYIPHFVDYKNPSQEILEEGKIICIEPMITPGSGRMAISTADKWTAFCVDRQPCVMFEEMILITEDSYEILTDHLGNKGKILE